MTDAGGKKRLLWHSNTPFGPTGYGIQTALFAPYIAEHYDLAISAFYGLEGAPIKWEGIPVLPGLGGDFGNETLPLHATRFFGGDKSDGLVVILADVWPFDARMARTLPLACWTPVDHDPVPPKVYEFLVQSGAVPIAMSRFGERQLKDLNPLFVPHGVDCQTYKPLEKEKARQGAFPDGAFVVGMVGANKGHPARKAFSQALTAFSRFAKRHDNAYLYLHTVFDPNHGAGENLPAMIKLLGIPDKKIRAADQYSLMYSPYSAADMAKIYSALDVLLHPSFGEGFGCCAAEAQACGVPVIATDFTAMTEVVGAGWHVKWAPYWSGLNSWQAIPDIDDIESALEECYAMSPAERAKLSKTARRHVVRNYEAEMVARRFMLPALREAERRINANRLRLAVPQARQDGRPTVSVVTPWLNHPEFRDEYDQAMLAGRPDEVLIIDNGSDPPVPDAAYRFEENVGFAAACNKGLEMARADVVLFLNNDIRMIRPDWLDQILAVIEPGRLVGAMLRNDPHGWVDGEPSPYLDGWCVAGMRTDFERLAGWDTSYMEPCYYGDNDLSLRAGAGGMELAEVPVLGLEHILGGTSAHDPRARDEATVFNQRLFADRVRMLRAARRTAVA